VALQSILLVLVFPLIGLLIALRPSAIPAPRPARSESGPKSSAEDPPPSTGMLDE